MFRLWSPLGKAELHYLPLCTALPPPTHGHAGHRPSTVCENFSGLRGRLEGGFQPGGRRVYIQNAQKFLENSNMRENQENKN